MERCGICGGAIRRKTDVTMDSRLQITVHKSCRTPSAVRRAEHAVDLSQASDSEHLDTPEGSQQPPTPSNDRINFPNLKQIRTPHMACIFRCDPIQGTLHRVSNEDRLEALQSSRIDIAHGERVCEKHLEEKGLTKSEWFSQLQPKFETAVITAASFTNLVNALFESRKEEPSQAEKTFDRMNEDELMRTTKLNRDQFNQMLASLPELRVKRPPSLLLGIFMNKLVTDTTDDQLSLRFGIKRRTVNEAMQLSKIISVIRSPARFNLTSVVSSMPSSSSMLRRVISRL